MRENRSLMRIVKQINSRIWVNFTRNGLRLGSRHQEPPHTDVSRNLATVVVRGVLPRLRRRRTGLLPSSPKSSFQMRASFVFHLETAEEIQGLTSNPENVLFRGPRKCTDSVHLSVVCNASNQDGKTLQRVVGLAERISGSALPSLQDIYLKRCKSRASKIIKDSNHPGNRLFFLLPSGKRFRSMMAKTDRLRRSFFPQAIRYLNSNSVK